MPEEERLRDLITDALRHWELRRVFYNALLAVIVLGHFAAVLTHFFSTGMFGAS